MLAVDSNNRGKTFVIPVDTLMENFLGATEYAVNTTFLKFIAELHIKHAATWNCSHLAITIYA